MLRDDDDDDEDDEEIGWRTVQVELCLSKHTTLVSRVQQ